MTQNDDWKAVLIDGIVYEKQADGTLSPAPGRMDFDKIDALNDADIEQLAASDDEGLPAPETDWTDAFVTRQKRLAQAQTKTKAS